MPRRRSSTPAEEPEKKHRVTLAQLCSYDDVATDVMVDQAYFWSRIRKNRSKHFPVRGVKEDGIPQILLHQVIVAKDVDKAEKIILGLPGLKRYLGTLRERQEKNYFQKHIRKYIEMYLPDSPFEVSTTNRYTITTSEAAVTARKQIRKGQKVKYLTGTMVAITEAESKDLDLTQRNFSLVTSVRKKTSAIFLGPARFANHDCEANGRLEMAGYDSMEVVATKNIDIGDEITVTYGDDYFGPNNEECLCRSCEIASRNGWTSADAFGVPKSGTSTPDTENQDMELASMSRKRKIDADTSSESSTGLLSSSLKKRKLEPQNSRLAQQFTPPVETDLMPEVDQIEETGQTEEPELPEETTKTQDSEVIGSETPLQIDSTTVPAEEAPATEAVPQIITTVPETDSALN